MQLGNSKLVTAVVTLFSVISIGSAFDCKKIKIVGYDFDLSPLAHEIKLETNSSTPPSITNIAFTINPCAPLELEKDNVPSIDRCPENSWVCRKSTNYKEGSVLVTEVNTVAGIKKDDNPEFESTTSGNKSPSEFHWKMKGAEVEKKSWSTDIKFICDKKAKNTDQPKVIEFNEGVLSLEWSVPAACALGDDNSDDKDDGKKPDNDGKEPEKAGSRGFFSILFTLLFFAFLLYFVLGIMYNWLVVRSTGLDLIPNLAFWREFPYLCIDFAQHVWDIVSGRRRGGYSVV